MELHAQSANSAAPSTPMDRLTTQQRAAEIARYADRLRAASRHLREALDEASRNSQSNSLTIGYQAAHAAASTSASSPTNGSSSDEGLGAGEGAGEGRFAETDFAPLWPIFDPAILEDIEQGVDVPELEEEVQATLSRIEVTLEQIAGMENDRLEERLVAMRSVLARPEFQEELTLWQRFMRWLDDLIDRYFPQSQSQGNGAAGGIIGRIVGWALAIGGAIALVILLSYWIQRLAGNFARNATLTTDPWADDYPLTAQQAREQATQQAQSGNYRGAVRQLYLAALLTLEEQGAIRYDRSQTNHEVLAQVKNDAAVAEHLRPVVETFDDVWYGVQEPDQETYSGYTQEVDQLTQAAAEGKPVAEARAKRSTSGQAVSGGNLLEKGDKRR